MSLPASTYIFMFCAAFLIAFYHLSLSSGVSYSCNAMNGEQSINIPYKIRGLDVSGLQQRVSVFRTRKKQKGTIISAGLASRALNLCTVSQLCLHVAKFVYVVNTAVIYLQKTPWSGFFFLRSH